MPRWQLLRASGLTLVTGAKLLADLDGSYLLPLDHTAIRYMETPANDAVTRLGKRIYRRLFEVLTGKDTSKPFERLPAEDRRNVLEILRATKKELPAYWSPEAQAE